jgi:hypothetical protein
VRLFEEDAVAQEIEACPAVHLSLDQLGLGVDAFGAAVVVFAGQGGADGVLVKSETADERVDVRQVRLVRGADPLLQPVSVVVGGGEELGEGADQCGELVHLRAGVGGLVDQL